MERLLQVINDYTSETARMSDSSDDENATLTPKRPTGHGWKSSNHMANKRGMAGAVCVNHHQFLVIGGSSDFDHYGSHLNSCEYYDAKTEQWIRLKINLPTARSGFGVASVDNQIFLMGGMNDSESCMSQMISIAVPGDDLSTISENLEWETLAPMETARSLFACAVHSKYIYVIGGVDSNKATTDTAERYNTKTKKWTRLPNMPGKRFGCAAGVVGNKIYVVGGEDMNDNELSSTYIFDINTGQWESSNPIGYDDLTTAGVPDMKEKRGMLSVVVVDHFVLAIGGGDEDGNLLNSIEVLDTQRNVWSNAQSSMIHGSCYQAAGYLKATKEVIVAGGANEEAANVTNRVDSIKFEEELLPPKFRAKIRGQTIIGDIDQGKDRLGVSIIAEALAETLVFKDLEPPFVLGILGKWGRGKSYFFNLMLEHIISIQMQSVDRLVRNTYAGHIYIVKFDAWTFSKGNIWTSLMYQILKTLNEQLQFEEGIGKETLEAGSISAIEAFRDISKRDDKQTSQGWESYLHNRVKENGDLASERLVKAINVNYEKEQEELEEIETEIKKIQAKRIRKRAKNATDLVGKIIVEKAVENAIKLALKEKILFDSKDNQSIDKLILHIDNTDDYNNLISAFKMIKWWNYRCLGSNIPPFGWICSAIFLILSFVLFLIFKDIVVTVISALISASFLAVTNFSSACKKLDPIIAQLNHQAGANEDIEIGDFDEEDVILLKNNEEKKLQIQNRSLVLKGHSLREAIAKEYESNLGLLYKVQQDLQRISDGMLHNEHLFPRGDPRIVLFVDNLDRCPQGVVVEVIEALQLLVKTNLFVAALAIDPRYITLSLEKYYGGILAPKNAPTGIDFLEKIIQVPFSLPAVGQNYIDSFVTSQIDIEKPHDLSKSNINVVERHSSGNISPLSTSSNTVNSQIMDISAVSQIVGGGQTASERNAVGVIPRDKVLFTEEEGTMMTEMLKLFGVNPRGMRRVINVFKVLSVIWQRDSVRFEADHNLKRATLFLILLSSEESAREVTYTIFEWMEIGVVKYHHVMKDGEGAQKNENNLANLFKTKLQEWDVSFYFPSTQGTIMAYVDEYLSEYKWANFQEWYEISSKFLLARSFSFFRVISEDINSRERVLSSRQPTKTNHHEGRAQQSLHIDPLGRINQGDIKRHGGKLNPRKEKQFGYTNEYRERSRQDRCSNIYRKVTTNIERFVHKDGAVRPS